MIRTSKELAAWIAQGERGAAADTVVECLTQIPLCTDDSFGAYPRTPTELRHCFLLVEAVPSLRDRLGEVRVLGSQWSALVEHWRELEQLFFAEGGATAARDEFMPQTYLRLRELLDGATDRRNMRTG